MYSPLPPTFVVIGTQSWSFLQKSFTETAYCWIKENVIRKRHEMFREKDTTSSSCIFNSETFFFNEKRSQILGCSFVSLSHKSSHSMLKLTRFEFPSDYPIYIIFLVQENLYRLINRDILFKIVSPLFMTNDVSINQYIYTYIYISVLLYGCTTWTLTLRMEKKLDCY